MTLILTIENQQSLPNGGPVSITLPDGRGLEIGRNDNLDWTLPDPSRFVSGKHCEVRGRDGAYWLHAVSTNGTFLNDNAHRIQAPYRLRHGDRLTIGPYVIGVTILADPNPLPGRGGRAPPPRPLFVSSRRQRPASKASRWRRTQNSQARPHLGVRKWGSYRTCRCRGLGGPSARTTGGERAGLKRTGKPQGDTHRARGRPASFPPAGG